MRRQKRLSLSKETVRALEAHVAELAAGGVTGASRCNSFCLKCANPETYDFGCSLGFDCTTT